MALAMGKWGCWLAVAVHVVVRGKEAMTYLYDYDVYLKLLDIYNQLPTLS